MNFYDKVLRLEKMVRTALNRTSYKKYVALLSQSGSSAPVATVLENTIGNIVWTRISSGIYTATLAGAFPAAKSLALVSNSGSVEAGVLAYDVEDTNSYAVQSFSGSSFSDSLLYLTGIEIRVYP